MATFTHLHVHSDYSLLNSTSTIAQMVGAARAHKMSHIALTDHGNLFGAIEFYKRCRNSEHGPPITPIIGCDVYLAPKSRHDRDTVRNTSLPQVVLLATDNHGYANLVQLTTRGFTEGFYYKPRIDDELLAQHSRGLIALCGGMYGDVGCQIRANRSEQAKQRVEFYLSVFGTDNFYLELQDHQTADEQLINQEIRRLAAAYNIGLVATNNSYYTADGDADAHNILLCIQSNRTRRAVGSIMPSDQYFIKSAQQMEALFGDIPDALRNTQKIAERCAVEINLSGPQLPNFDLPDDYTSPEQYLHHLAMRGLAKRYPQEHERLKARVEYELQIIAQTGYTGYFLIVWDFVHFARKNDIPVGPGRGSGAGSLVAYCLRITDIDPIRYRLLFERFLNPDRVSMPDFDIDFCYERRGELIEYITKKYGEDHVSQIITFGTLGAKAAVRDVARVLDIPFGTALEISKLIPFGPQVSLESALGSVPELKEMRKDPIYAELFSIGLKLEGLHRHASTHAAGIVIGRERLTNYVPLYRDPRSATITTQFSMEHLEECGLVKMDILGLKTLTLIKDCQELICRTDPDFDIGAIDINDAETFAMLARGESTAVFQFENSGMQQLLPRAKPERIEDLIALTSLYRPGPMEHIDRYVATKSGEMPAHYILPQLEELLAETYGIIVYQEQVIEIVKQIGGFSLGQADVMRWAMGKKKKDIMADMKSKFISGAMDNNLTEAKAEEIFETISSFAGYGFNKSHAAAYAMLAFQTAYLRAHFPLQFMAANLTNEMPNSDQFTRYLKETRRMGIEIIPPDIRISERDFSVQGDKIVFGLNAIKTVGSKAVEEIISARDRQGTFDSISDFLTAVNKSIINRKTVEACVLCGLFDAMDDNRAALHNNLDHYYSIAREQSMRIKTGQQSLFVGDQAVQSPSGGDTPPFTLEERVRYEQEYLGDYFSGHPLDNYEQLIHSCRPAMLDGASQWRFQEDHLVIAFVDSYKARESKSGNRFIVLNIADKSGVCECIKFSPSTEDIDILDNNPVIALKLRLSKRDLRTQLQVGDIYTMQTLKEQLYSSVHLTLLCAADLDRRLPELRELLLAHPGKCQVMFHVANCVVRSSIQMCVQFSEQLTRQLKQNSVVEQVRWL